MIRGHAHVILGMARVAIGLVGFRRTPLVVREVRLRDRDEHSDIIRRAKHLLQCEMGARFTTIIMGIDKVDPDALEALKAFPCRAIAAGSRPHSAIVERTAPPELP